MRQVNSKFLTIAFIAIVSFIFSACNSATTPNVTPQGAPDVAARVNGKDIKTEEVEKLIKQQAQGQESKLAPLELTQARLQVLENLIQQEVMYQKAEAEKTVPTEEEVNQEYNKRRTGSGLSADEFDKKMKEIGETEASAKEQIKRGLAVQKLIEKITSKVEPPKDAEIEAFYKGNPEAFVRKKGVRLAAIVVDPANNGEGDTTTDAVTATNRIKEIAAQLGQNADFATVARDKSEDQSSLRGGDLGYLPEEALQQNFPQLAQGFMDPQFTVGRIAGPFNIQGKFYLFKLTERINQDENLTLESPGVRQQITEGLINARKNLLSQSYAAMAMNEARIENYLAKRVVENPNAESGARPANPNPTAPPQANTNANTGANTNASAANANTANANAKPAASPAANGNANR